MVKRLYSLVIGLSLFVIHPVQAGLADYDLAGTKRASPATLGALEVQTMIVAPDTGMRIM